MPGTDAGEVCYSLLEEGCTRLREWLGCSVLRVQDCWFSKRLAQQLQNAIKPTSAVKTSDLHAFLLVPLLPSLPKTSLEASATLVATLMPRAAMCFVRDGCHPEHAHRFAQ